MRRGFLVLALTTLIPSMVGCAAAAGAAAGAAGAIAYDDRGVSTTVEASVSEVEQATEAVFSELGLAVAEREVEDEGEEIDLTGEAGEMRVNVEIEREDDGMASIEVTAREGTLDYDRSYAEDVLRRIIAAV